MEIITSTRLTLSLVTGYNEEGEPIFKARHFNNIIPESEHEKLFQTAVALASLQVYPLEKVERSNTYELNQ